GKTKSSPVMDIQHSDSHYTKYRLPPVDLLNQSVDDGKNSKTIHKERTSNLSIESLNVMVRFPAIHLTSHLN
ncbi:MAG TPA: hypothetical protein P5184_11875, partial [Bacteroidales bacterium]|nr:hypothetical protein [Bacteroidales bacterium]